MAIFYMRITNIKRTDGRSIVAASAYCSASKELNLYDGITHDYTNKSGCVYSSVMLPENAPVEFLDREKLWNSVETEMAKDRRSALGREVIIALPKEMSVQENIALATSFVQNTFVNDGMCAQLDIHIPDDSDNPHAHVLLTIREITPDGKWKPATEAEYICRNPEGKTGRFTADEFQKAKSEGYEKQYQYQKGNKKVYLTPSEAYELGVNRSARTSRYPLKTKYGRRSETILRWDNGMGVWKKSLENHINAALEQKGLDIRVSCLSYSEQGSERVSGIHLGPFVAKKKKLESERVKINADIETLNQRNEKISKTLDELQNMIQKKQEELSDKISDSLASVRTDMVEIRHILDTTLYEQKNSLDAKIEKMQDSIIQVQTAIKNAQSKDSISKEKIREYKEELSSIGKTPSNRRKELLLLIQNEDIAMKNRSDALKVILNNCGIKNYDDINELERYLNQAKSESKDIENRISFLEDKIQKCFRDYEELYRHIPENASDDFLKSYEQNCNKYEQETIRKHHHDTSFNVAPFHISAAKIDYTIKGIAFKVGRAYYLASRLQNYIDSHTNEYAPR